MASEIEFVLRPECSVKFELYAHRDVYIQVSQPIHEPLAVRQLGIKERHESEHVFGEPSRKHHASRITVRPANLAPHHEGTARHDGLVAGRSHMWQSLPGACQASPAIRR